MIDQIVDRHTLKYVWLFISSQITLTVIYDGFSAFFFRGDNLPKTPVSLRGSPGGAGFLEAKTPTVAFY